MGYILCNLYQMKGGDLLSIILHHNMDIRCAEDPFNMGMFFLYIRHPS